MDIRSLEHLLFGIRGSHLHWSAAGSPLSRVSADSRGYCSGEDPSTDPIVRAKILAARRAKLNETRIFTLVDTHTRTVTLFEAVRPPTALVIAASEGGMQRALLCSLDWRTQTLVRETVIRVETTSLSKMDRVGRLQLSLTSPDYSAERAEV